MRYHVLIIEDDSPLRELYALYLKRGNISSSAAPTAEQALRVLGTESFDAVLVDVNLGSGMSGLDFIEIMQQNPDFDHIKVIILTSFPEPFELSSTLRIDLSINKPVNYANLIKALDSVMDS